MAIWHGEEQPLGDDVTNSRTLPSKYYTNEEIFELEQEKIHADSWQFVGTTAELDVIGDYKKVDIAGQEVVVARSENGIQAFHNVCPHRGSQVVGEDEGNVDFLQCPYHGWTFQLTGDLIQAPNFNSTARNPYVDDDEIPDLDPKDDGLCSVNVDVLDPFIFVNLSDDPFSFDEFVGDLPKVLEKYELDNLMYGTSSEFHIDANWKFWIDNYLECDHCAHNHPSLVDTFDMEGWTSQLRDYYWLHVAPSDKENPGEYSPGEDDENEDGEYVVMWPNFTLNISPGPGDVTVGRIKPVGPQETYLKFDYYFTELSEVGEMNQRQKEMVEWFHEIAEEDTDIVETQHKGVSSGALKQGRFGPQEHAVHDFNKMIMAALNDESLTDRSTLAQHN